MGTLQIKKKSRSQISEITQIKMKRKIKDKISGNLTGERLAPNTYG
ncbi:MAG: hypothetical protein WC327_05110 [Candidatus Cloacimonadia bacterium]